MTNIFKSNSRFAALSEPSNEPVKNEKKRDIDPLTDDKPKKNSFKSNNERPVYNERATYNERPVYNERPTYNESNLFSQKVVDKAQKQRKEDEIQRSINEMQKTLSIDNFPELLVSNKTSEKPVISFADRLKQKQNITETNVENPVISFSEKLKQVDPVIETHSKKIPYGWAVIKRDNVTKKSYIEYNKDYERDNKAVEQMEKKQWPLKVLDALVDLYERERDEYINKWGYDAYEEKYLDPDYDDEYFDRLDEAYVSETEEEEDEDEEEEYMDQQYWKN
jgi:hypothetical protein